MKIKIKTKKELKRMFYNATGDNADTRPLAFYNFVTHIDEDLFGKKFDVEAVSKITEPLSLFDDMPVYFLINDGRKYWTIQSQFVKEIDL